MKKIVTSVLTVLMVGGLLNTNSDLSAVHARDLNEIIKSKTIRVGVNPNFPPMSSYGSTNEFEGFDIDIGNKIAAALGVEAKFVPTETAQRVPFLVSDKIDISLGALTRNTKRSLLISYTAPLHTEAMAVLTTDKLDITKWKELNDSNYTLANMRGNWTVGWTKDNLPNAKLELVDSDDPLEAGLELLVSPPGKRLQSITLLSGGEQALTALSLIFAVFLTNPSPICVLDEVDAPLDDANVTRFCNLLNDLTKITSTRFIIVTHHALTMSKMDRLYGVTMPEKGISQLVAVDLQKAESMVA